MTRCFWMSLNAVDASTSNVASTREAVTFACWPPGPEDLLTRTSTSESGIETVRVTRIGSSINRQFRIVALYPCALTVSEQNVEVVRQFYEAWSRDQYPGPMELTDPDVEYVNPGEAVEPGTHRGRSAFAEAIEKLLHSWEFWRAEIEEARPIGDHVAVVVTYRTRGRGSGMDIEGRESALWTFRNGKVVRYEWFKGTEEALAAALDAASPA